MSSNEKELERGDGIVAAATSDAPPGEAAATTADAQNAKDLEAGLPAEGNASATAGDGDGEKKRGRKKDVQIEDQSSRLPPKQLAMVLVSLMVVIILACIEQTSVSTALPSIARSLKCGTEVSWAGTSYLVANTASQGIYGRLSDLFSRKAVLVWAIIMFGLGSLLSGFSRNLAELIVFRAISGIGGGGMQVAVVVILSDLVSLRERAKIQGYLTAGTVTGIGIGPFLGGIFSENNWRWVFWVVCPPAALSVVQILLWLPLTPVKNKARSQLKHLDFLGSLTLVISIVFILVPISGGGSSYAWNSPLVISLLTVGGIFTILFLLVEHYYARLPVLPLKVFRKRSISAMVAAYFFWGTFVYAGLYFLPVYFQVVRQASPIKSSLLLFTMAMPQVLSIMVAGYLVQWSGRFVPTLWAGLWLYLVGAGLATRFDRNVSDGYICGTLIIQGVALGFTTQTGLITMQAHGDHADRAILTSLRNLIRFIGGSCGIAICSGILNNVAKQYVVSRDSSIPLGSSLGLDIPPGITHEQKEILLDGYVAAMKAIWWFFLAGGAMAVLIGFLITDVPLRGDEKKKEGENKEKKDEVEGGEKKDEVEGGEKKDGEEVKEKDETDVKNAEPVATEPVKPEA